MSWVHFGDVHTEGEEDENYLDSLELSEEANENPVGEMDFAFLSGDNAEDGIEAEYKLPSRASDLQPLMFPHLYLSELRISAAN